MLKVKADMEKMTQAGGLAETRQKQIMDFSKSIEKLNPLSIGGQAKAEIEDLKKSLAELAGQITNMPKIDVAGTKPTQSYKDFLAELEADLKRSPW